MDELEEAIGLYWDCAYQEGHLQRPDGDKANEILHRILDATKALVLAEREACAKVCEGIGWGKDKEVSPAAGCICADAIRTRSNAR